MDEPEQLRSGLAPCTPAVLVMVAPATTPGVSSTLNCTLILPPGGRLKPGKDHDSLHTRLTSVQPGTGGLLGSPLISVYSTVAGSG